MHPAGPAIDQHAVFDVIHATGHCLITGSDHAFPVVGMDTGQIRIKSGRHIARHAENPPRLIRPLHPTGAKIDHPAAQSRHSLRLLQVGGALVNRIFQSLFLSAL